MKKWLGLAIAISLVSCCAFAQNHISYMKAYHGEDPNPLSGCYNNTTCQLDQHGGPVDVGGEHVYIVYYGSWTSTDMGIINTYFEQLGGSAQEKINTYYGESTGKYINGKVTYNPSTDSYQDNYSMGKNLSDVQPVIAAAIKGGHLPNNKKGIYFCLTYKDVNYANGAFCNQYCGYHGPSNSIVSGETIQYSFVGDPGRCADNCSYEFLYGSHASPNNDIDADGSINIMWHEFSESSSDPLISAWISPVGYESGDLCAWLNLNYKVDKNGNYYTVLTQGHEYLTQMMFELDNKATAGDVNGVCENHFVKKP